MHRQYARRHVNRMLVALVPGGLVLARPALGTDAQEASPAASPAAGSQFELVWETDGGAAPFTTPVGVAVDPNGTIYVTDSDANNVKVFDAAGGYLRTIGERGSGEGQFAFDGRTVYAAVDADGNLYVGDHKNPRVQKFDRDGNFLLAFGSFGTGDGQFLSPEAVSVDAAGNVLVADSERRDAQWFDSDGTFLGTFGENVPDDQIGTPGLMSADRQGHLWLCSGGWDGTVPRVQEFDAEERLLRTVGSPGSGDGQYQVPVAVAVDKAGYIYIGDPTLAAVLVYDPAGNYVAELTGSGVGDHRFREISHIALSPDGDLYVVDILDDRVFKFRLLPPLASEATPAT